MIRLRSRTLFTVVALLIVAGGLVRLALDDEVVDVAMPQPPAEQGPADQGAAPIVPAGLTQLAAER